MIGYARVSTDEQAETGAGLDAQRAALHACGHTIDRIETDALSGRTLNRPGLELALTDLAAGRSDGLVVAKLDRLSRSVVDVLALADRAQHEGWHLVALDFGLDTTTPAGRLTLTIMAAVSQWEREVISVRTREGLAARRAAGVRLGRESAIPEDLAARIRAMRATRSLRGICDELNREGVPTPRGGELWRPSSLTGVLS